MSDLSIEHVDRNDEVALRAWFELLCAVQAADHPEDPPVQWLDVRARLTPRVDKESHVWLARHGDAAGPVVAAGFLMLFLRDNLDNAIADVFVHPEHRRRGIGRQVLAHLADAARADGRKRLIIEAHEPLDSPSPGSRFLGAAGARMVLADRRRRLDIPTPDEAALVRLLAEARAAAAGYELVQWIGATPERHIDDLAMLVGRMSTDTPLDDLQLEPEVWDAARLRSREAVNEARGLRSVVTAAAGPDGRLVGYTVIICHAAIDWFGHQGDTIVLSEHRGHRLGMLLKLANLEFARAQNPALRMIDTYNADSNPHMVAINEAMGFHQHDRLGEWELTI